MFGILSHKRNANQNYTETLSHPIQNDHHQDNKKQSKDAGKKNPCTLLVGM
jgi:hypothetical protein